MSRSFTSQNFTAYMMLIGGIVLTVYVLFVYSNSLWEARRKEILYAEFQEDIQRLEEENETLTDRYWFQKTEQYFDKYAKTNLGKVNPGEKVIILPQEDEINPLDFTGLTPEEIEREILKNRPIREQWWHFFFE